MINKQELEDMLRKEEGINEVEVKEIVEYLKKKNKEQAF